MAPCSNAAFAKSSAMALTTATEFMKIHHDQNNTAECAASWAIRGRFRENFSRHFQDSEENARQQGLREGDLRNGCVFQRSFSAAEETLFGSRSVDVNSTSLAQPPNAMLCLAEKNFFFRPCSECDAEPRSSAAPSNRRIIIEFTREFEILQCKHLFSTRQIAEQIARNRARQNILLVFDA